MNPICLRASQTTRSSIRTGGDHLTAVPPLTLSLAGELAKAEMGATHRSRRLMLPAVPMSKS